MKRLTCYDVGGACDAMLSGSSLEELGMMAKKHAMEANDDAHKQKMTEMMAKSPEEQQAFWQEMTEKFKAAPEAE